MPDDSAAAHIDAAVSAIEKPVTELFTYSRQNRTLIRVLAISLILDVLLSIATAVGVAYAVHASNLANSANRSVQRACQARNEYKVLDLQRWQYIINLSAGAPPVGTTPAQQKAQAEQTTKFKAYIAGADTPETCR